MGLFGRGKKEPSYAEMKKKIEKMEKKDDIKHLCKTLNSEFHTERVLAISALGRIRTPVAVEPLMKSLKDPKASVRSSAAESLGRIGDKRAAKPLIDALKDPDQFVRGRAAIALGQLADGEAIEPLLNLLKDPYHNARRDAIGSLCKISKTTGDKRAVEPILDALKDSEADVRSTAALYLRHINDKRIVEPLIEALKDPEVLVRADAASSLGQIGDRRAIEPLITLLKGLLIFPENNIRGRGADEVVEALGLIGDMRAIDVLTEASKKGENSSSVLVRRDTYHLREKAANALALIRKRFPFTPEITSYVCDGCGRKMAKREGYMLKSWQKNKIVLATNQGNWPPKNVRNFAEAFGSSWQQAYINNILTEMNDWLLCGECICLLPMTNLELDKAKSGAQQWWLSH